MNKALSTLLLLASTFGFANETPLPPKSEYITNADPIENLDTEGTFYLRAVTTSQAFRGTTLFPGLGVGYRRFFGHSGVDFSLNYSEGAGWRGTEKFIAWTYPKVSYLYKISSLYAGTGFGWGGAKYIKRGVLPEEGPEHSSFVGLIPHVTFGYEFLHTSIISSFTEINISQPLIPKTFTGEINPSPSIELSVGAGF